MGSVLKLWHQFDYKELGVSSKSRSEDGDGAVASMQAKREKLEMSSVVEGL